MAQQIPLTFSEVLNLPSLGVSANAIKFGARDPSHRYRNISAPFLNLLPGAHPPLRARHRRGIGSP